MTKTVVSLEFDHPAAAAAFLASLAGAGTQGNAPAQSTSAPARTPPPPAQTAAPVGAPPPANSAPSGAPPKAPASPPPPPPAAPANGGPPTVQQVLASMQEYAKTYKAAGVKAVLGQCNLTKVTDANAEQLVWLKATFDANQPVA